MIEPLSPGHPLWPQALAGRYSPAVLHLLPLADAFAVLGVSREPRYLVSTLAEAREAHALIDWTNYPQQRVEARRTILPGLDLSGLTL
jgi:hypothetical protein